MYDMQLQMKLCGFYCNSWPRLTVKQDNKTIYEKVITDQHSLELDLENKPFSIGMKNKRFGLDNVWDTHVDADGNIIADKYIKIKRISLDDVEFEKNLHKLSYQSKEHGVILSHDKTIRFNGYWQFDVDNNPYDWIIDLNNRSDSNERTDVSYFSNYESHSNYDDHHKIIAEIREMI